ncbi:putative aminopeptidase TDEL_0A03810 [Torulaspora delbrueckii]|uniref:Peptide hydrolase n=1 Tax=Torulaspora delbrueckii TaxID=4950 RepID=G8ZM69_TORDE|nr:hypothetical protein TDEL_0A03810 [Torulaspora delbrueckii]CCE89713.1 hypothetical protein TDEL_0A03810 [Torulaspora delbrueckii]
MRSRLFVFISLVCLCVAIGSNDVRILEIGKGERIEVRESEKGLLKRRGVGFIDVTDHLNWPWSKNVDDEHDLPSYNYPKQTSEVDSFENLSTLIDKDEMYMNLANFCSFFTRYYKSPSGYESALWLSEIIHNITDVIPKGAVEIEHFDHKKWRQFSIIVRIPGHKTPENLVVMGSHLDSLNLIFPSWIATPGADDNGSGTVTNLEALRVYAKHIADGNFPDNTVEFHFYSAEEGGLLGSMDVFSSYKEQEKLVVAMIQQDMTGYVRNKRDEHIGLVTDFTDPALVDFMKVIINSYASIPYRETTCGYACSDHGSAMKNGFPAAFILESEYNKTNQYIHTTMDTLDRLSFDHMAEHAKVTLGAVLELANWEFMRLT